MDWDELLIPDPPKTENVQLNVWLTQVTTHLRKYLGGLELNDSIFNDRGDPSAFDFDEGDLTTNGSTWNDLDLSAIVPAGAKAVVLYVVALDNAADSDLVFREKGNSNSINKSKIRTQVANVAMHGDMIVPCDSDRHIECLGANVTFTTIGIAVKGWFL